MCCGWQNIRQGNNRRGSRILGLWRIYPLTREAGTSLLVSGVGLHGQTVVCFDKNPYILRGGGEAPTTKLYISDIPINVDDGEIRTHLERLGCVIPNPKASDRARNKDSKLACFLKGRWFVFIEILSSPLQRSVEMVSFRATLYHIEMKSKERKKKKKMLKMFAYRPYGLNLQLKYSLPFLLSKRTHGHRRQMWKLQVVGGKDSCTPSPTTSTHQNQRLGAASQTAAPPRVPAVPLVCVGRPYREEQADPQCFTFAWEREAWFMPTPSFSGSCRLLLSVVHAANNQRETVERTAAGGKRGWQLTCISSVPWPPATTWLRLLDYVISMSDLDFRYTIY